jgi:tRNA(fMet)-specific endonuclease VapC
MAKEVVLADSSILIDFFRKKDKNRTFLIELHRRKLTVRISSITEFEIYSGATMEQSLYWEGFLKRFKVLQFGSDEARQAAEMTKAMKRNRNLIATADLFIGAIALTNKIPLATLDRTHFERIEGLTLVDPTLTA